MPKQCHNRDLFVNCQLWGIGRPRERYPRIVMRPRDPEDADAIAKALRQLVPLGMEVETSVVRDRLGWPDPPEGAEVLRASARLPAGAATARALGQARERGTAGKPPGLLEELEVRAIDGWQPVMDPMLELVRELAARASSHEEFLAGLPALLGEMEPSELVRALASAAFAARGLGDARDEP